MGEIKRIENIAVDKLIPYVNNAKVHSEDQVTRIASSIREFGFLSPVLVDKDYNIIAGHGRVMAAKKLGLSDVPCVYIEGLSEAQRKAYILADNRLGELADWDMDMVTSELEMLLDNDFDINLTGFELPEEQEETEIKEDEVPEEVETRCKHGDLWELGGHRLICGDSTDIAVIDRLMDGVKADCVFTDPPYGMKLDTDFSGMRGTEMFQKEKGIKPGKKYRKIIGDNEDFKPELIKTIFDNFCYCDEIFIWGADYYPELLQGYKDGSILVWDKKSNDGVQTNLDKAFTSDFELVWSKSKHKKSIIRILWSSAFGTEQEFDHKRSHPTQKPTKLAVWFLERYSKDGDNVVDLYGGSGSTLIACEQLNRKCFMCELDPHYCDVIIQRWENFTGQKAVLLNE